MQDEVIEVLKNCTVEGNVVKLPGVQLDRKVYIEVKKSLELIGGCWKGGKVFGFVFPDNPAALLSQISQGEVRNLKKEFQFFETPGELADRIVSIANIKSNTCVLEPSAGRGAIVKAVQRKIPGKIVNCCEIMDINLGFLNKIPHVRIIVDDFFKLKSFPDSIYPLYDRIVANPPFSKNQDIDHIMEMWDHLKVGGKLVSVASTHWQISDNKKEKAFRGFLEKHQAKIIPVEKGTFKESGTTIATNIIVINKG